MILSHNEGHMSDYTKDMSAAELQSEGYLLEVNRRFFHPLGLALSVVDDPDGKQIGRIIDNRDDPEGMYFELDREDLVRAENIATIEASRRTARETALGYWIQPVTEG